MKSWKRDSLSHTGASTPCVQIAFSPAEAMAPAPVASPPAAARTCHAWLISAIKMTMGMGTPTIKSKIERMLKPPYVAMSNISIKRRFLEPQSEGAPAQRSAERKGLGKFRRTR